MKKLPLPLKVKRAKKFELDLENSNFRKYFAKVKKSLGLKKHAQ